MRLSFYTVNADYCDFLRQEDPCVPYTMDIKSNRPFIGIVLQINNFSYYAPLTSPKPKHLKMKNQVDFLKIQDGRLGAINFNNMIPVPQEHLTKVDPSRISGDSTESLSYKALLEKQLSWCNSHRAELKKQASKLYIIITTNKAWGKLKARCCNFTLAETRSLKFAPANKAEINSQEEGLSLDIGNGDEPRLGF